MGFSFFLLPDYNNVKTPKFYILLVKTKTIYIYVYKLFILYTLYIYIFFIKYKYCFAPSRLMDRVPLSLYVCRFFMFLPCFCSYL